MNQQKQPPTKTNDGLYNVGLVLLGAVIILSVVTWAAGELSARLFNGADPKAGSAEMFGVLLKLFSHPGSPASAWPEASRIPGPAAFWMTFVVLVAPLVALAIFGLSFAKRKGRKGSLPGSSSAWASMSELKSLIVKQAERGRLVLGRSGKALLAAEERQSVIVLGPTQSMKTTGFAIPSILEWRGPVVATSVKSDLVRDTIEARRARGKVWVYDPTRSTGIEPATWSPLSYCKEWSGAQATALWLSWSGRGDGSSGIADADFWYMTAAKMLGPFLYAAANTGRGMKDVVAWVDTQNEKEVRRILAEELRDEEALRAVASTMMKEARQKSSIYTTAETVLQAYADPVVASSASSSEFSPKELLDGGEHTLYVCAPSHEQKRLRPLFETLIRSIINETYQMAGLLQGPIDPALLVVLDEAANIAPLKDLDVLASTAAGQGIQLVSVWQDMSQMIRRYGDAANTVFNNHKAKVVLSGISDPPTLEAMSRLIGDEEVKFGSVTTGSQGGTSTTESTGYRALAPAHALRGIRPGHGVLIYGHLAPVQVELRPWFKDKALKEMVEEARPKQLEIPDLEHAQPAT